MDNLRLEGLRYLKEALEEYISEVEKPKRAFPVKLKKKHFSPEARKRMSMLMKKRWAAARKKGKRTI